MLDKYTRIGLLAPITWSIPPKGYGPWEKVVANLAKGLVARGYQNVIILATKDTNVPGAEVEAIINQPLGEPAPVNHQELNTRHIEHACEFAMKHLDIIHNHFNYQPLEKLSKLSIPIVTTMHGSGFEPKSKEGYLKHRDSAYVSISDSERLFVPELNYVATVYNGINFEEFTLNASPENYLVNVGRIHPTKGVHNAVELARKLNYPLKIAGPITDDQQDYFHTKIEPFVDGKLIEYLGNLPLDEAAKLVRNATAAVGLIEWEEPFGLSVAEAMASGTPVIGTPRGSHKEIIKDGVTGILVENVDQAVARFAEVKTIDRQRCRQAAREMFSLEKMTEGYLAVYEDLLSAH